MGVRSPYRPGVTSGTKGQALRQIERQRCQDMGQQSGVFPLESRACCPVLPVSLLFVVALTGIERVWRQFRPVHLRLSVCKHVRPVRRWLRRNRHGSLAWHRGGTLVAPRGHVSRTGRARSHRRRAVAERCQPTTGALRSRTTNHDPRTRPQAHLRSDVSSAWPATERTSPVFRERRITGVILAAAFRSKET